MATIIVERPKDRKQLGTLRLLDGAGNLIAEADDGTDDGDPPPDFAGPVS